MFPKKKKIEKLQDALLKVEISVVLLPLLWFTDILLITFEKKKFVLIRSHFETDYNQSYGIEFTAEI